jgi:hypothetical protein
VNETIAMVLVGILFSLSAGVRITLPLLALNLLAYHHVVTLPPNLAWMGTEQTLLLLGVAFIAETLVHFIPVVGTGVKAAVTPLTFAAGTLLMAVPLADKTPLVQWALAGIVGGGLATLTHASVTGLRTVSAPANLATGGLFGLVWNGGELLVSALFSLLALVALWLGWILGIALLVLTLAAAGILAHRQWKRVWRLHPI